MGSIKNNKNKDTSTVEVIGIRFPNNMRIYYFDPNAQHLEVGTFAVVKGANGLDLVEVVVENKFVQENDIVLPLKQIIRKATKEDMQKAAKQNKQVPRTEAIFKKIVKKEGLELNLVNAHYTFDGSQITFRYTADGRVDFRELVKKLAKEFNRRIEMRQINMREKASIIGGVGPCGYDLCCRTFLHDLHGSTIKMVKNQRLSLIPERISGVCDKLLCCLRYEDDTYTELAEFLPDVKQTVVTPDGKGIVVYVNVLRQSVDVLVENENGSRTRKTYPYQELQQEIVG